MKLNRGFQEDRVHATHLLNIVPTLNRSDVLNQESPKAKVYVYIYIFIFLYINMYI